MKQAISILLIVLTLTACGTTPSGIIPPKEAAEACRSEDLMVY